MSITLTVLTINGVDDPSRLSATFDALGGSIGRAGHNQLVLPDARRSVSRLHAQLVFRSGAFAVIDRGSNPILLNGVAIGRDREAALRPGDRLRIGDYLLLASAGAPSLLPDGSPDGVDDPTHGGIPLDWDPFAVVPPASDPQRSRPLPRMPDTAGDAEMSLDALFGLPPTGTDYRDILYEPPGDRPFGAAATGTDLLGLPDDLPDPAGTTERDDLSDLRRAFTPPAGVPRRAPGPVEVRTVAPPAAPPPIEAPPKAAPRPAPENASGADLLAALRDGLDCPELSLQTLDPALMRLLGQLLRGSLQGTLDLLRARQDLKRDLHADQTVIGLRDNNLLKFSPDVEAALQQLLNAPPRGFLGPVASLHQAFDDLRRHQAAVGAGLGAALSGLVAHFDPAAIVAGLEPEPQTAWHRLKAGSRDAARWDAFVALHRRTAQDTLREPYGVFGGAFRDAYRAQPGVLHPRRLRHAPAAQPASDTPAAAAAVATTVEARVDPRFED